MSTIFADHAFQLNLEQCGITRQEAYNFVMAIPNDKRELYPSQTKILEGVTKDEMRIFEALFKGGSTQFGPRTIEKCFENPHFIFCYSFQNLRLGSINLFISRYKHCHAVVSRVNLFIIL
jgi:hypothetical protein